MPSGREFSPKELESFVFWREEHQQLVGLLCHISSPPVCSVNALDTFQIKK
ncbi:hypothetical protein THZB04_50380 [Vibrio owensii]|nr:hypothetical protein THZB04_50380 [Vibrio owensii]